MPLLQNCHGQPATINFNKNPLNIHLWSLYVPRNAGDSAIVHDVMVRCFAAQQGRDGCWGGGLPWQNVPFWHLFAYRLVLFFLKRKRCRTTLIQWCHPGAEEFGQGVVRSESFTWKCRSFCSSKQGHDLPNHTTCCTIAIMMNTFTILIACFMMFWLVLRLQHVGRMCALIFGWYRYMFQLFVEHRWVWRCQPCPRRNMVTSCSGHKWSTLQVLTIKTAKCQQYTCYGLEKINIQSSSHLHTSNSRLTYI